MNRINIKALQPLAYKAMLTLDDYASSTDIGPLQQELIKIRAAQLNGCSYCINTHTYDARKLGEKEHRIYALNAWRETPFFTEEERAILALTEEVTMIHEGVSDETYGAAIDILGENKVAQTIM